MHRRKFIKDSTAALLAASILANRPIPLFGNTSPTDLVTVVDSDASYLSSTLGKIPNRDEVIVDYIQEYSINRLRIANMVDTAVLKLTGKGSVGKAWQSLFPPGFPNKDTTVCVKLNLSYGERIEENDWTKTTCPFGPKDAVSEAIVMGLTQMLDGTFPIENITLFDSVGYGKRLRNSLVQGYRPVQANPQGDYKSDPTGTFRLHWVNPRQENAVPEEGPRFLAAPRFPIGYRAPQRIYTVPAENDFMINLVNPKTHREAGITGTMKNLYGCTDNPVGTHGTTEWQYPDSPYPGTGMCAPVFYKSIDQHTPIILNVLDALAGVYYGGPLAGKVFKADTIAVSQDPVVVDSYILQLVNENRKKQGFPLLTTDDGRASDGFPNAKSIRIASEEHQLGSMSLLNKSTYDITGNKPEYQVPSMDKSQSRVGDVVVGSNKCEIGLYMDNSKREHIIESSIRDLSGAVAHQFPTKKTRREYSSLRWDYHEMENPNGPFTWETSVDGIRHFRVFEPK